MSRRISCRCIPTECNTPQPRFGICPDRPVAPEAGPRGPQGIPGTAFNSFLNYYQTTAPITAIPGAIMIINQVGLTNGTDISYDTVTGVMTINTTGIYVFNWHFNIAAEEGFDDLIISLENAATNARINLTGFTTTEGTPVMQVSGSAIAILTAGTIVAFRNRSDTSVTTVVTTSQTDSYNASFTVHRIY